jgi:hypothetical protein
VAVEHAHRQANNKATNRQISRTLRLPWTPVHAGTSLSPSPSLPLSLSPMSLLCTLPGRDGPELVSALAELSESAHTFRATASVRYLSLGPSSPPATLASPEPFFSLPRASAAQAPTAAAATVQAYASLGQHGFAVDETRAPVDEDDNLHTQELAEMLANTELHAGSSAARTASSSRPAGVRRSADGANFNAGTKSASRSAAPEAASPSGSMLKAPLSASECVPGRRSVSPAGGETTPCSSPTRPCLRTAASPESPEADPESPEASPEASPVRKRLSWADQGGCALVAAMPFMRDDEPWRCARSGRRVPALLGA